MMGNVQGRSLTDEGPGRIRDVTHASYGRRTQHLLVQTLRVLAAQSGAPPSGVDPEIHDKGRWNVRDSRLRFDYSAFCVEHEGVRDANGNWTMPLDTALRPLEEVQM